MKDNRASCLRCLVLAVVGLFPAALAAGQPRIAEWVSADLSTQRVTTIAIDSQRSTAPTVYAGTDSAGVFVTSDGGATWTTVNSGLPDMSITALVILRPPPLAGCPPPCVVPTTVLAGTAHSGVFELIGSTWIPINAGLGSLFVSSLAVEGSQLYAGTTNAGTFKSSDYGASWTAMNAGLASLNVRAVATLPGTTIVLAGTVAGAFRSTDAAGTWAPLVVDPAVFLFQPTTFTVDPASLLTIYAAGLTRTCASPCTVPPTGGLYRSTDGGLTWQSIGVGLRLGLAEVSAVAVSPVRPTTVWAAKSGVGVFESLDAGTTWTAATTGLGNFLVTALADDAYGETVLYAGTSAGMYRALLGGICASSDTSLCLGDQRFAVTVSWRDSQGQSRVGYVLPLTSSTGSFWFFSSDNLELVVKVLDGRQINGKWWVFYGALSNVEYTITVTDTQTGATRTYFNPQGQLASFADTSAF